MAEPEARQVAAVRAAAESIAPEVIELAAQIAAVPAPTGDEFARSRVVADLFGSAGSLTVETDALGDVVARLRGSGPGPSLLLAAHLDTVFPAGTDLTVRRDGDRVAGPGIGDNSLGVAAVVLVPELLRRLGARPAVDLLLTGNVGEEGLGNLRGMRAVMDRWPEIGAAVAIEGQNLGRVTHVAVGSRRLRITTNGPGGHSWGDFGRPSAIHALARLIAQLADLPLLAEPKTTLNAGTITGGISVNTIAPSASCVLDMRSTDSSALDRLAAQVEELVARAGRDGITTEIEVLGVRPAGTVPLDSLIVRIAGEMLAALGVSVIFDASSTDANVPIARGIPAICVGLTTGGNAHRLDEYIEVGPVATGLAQLALLALRLGDALARGDLTAPRPNPVA